MSALPYETATSGHSALLEIQKILNKFGCESFGQMIDSERGMTIVQFRWKGRMVTLEASWKGYAAAWLKRNPYGPRTRCTRQQHEARAMEQAKISVCSVLRDQIKGNVTAIECGSMSFERAFLAHMTLPNGELVAEYVEKTLLQLPSK